MIYTKKFPTYCKVQVEPCKILQIQLACCHRESVKRFGAALSSICYAHRACSPSPLTANIPMGKKTKNSRGGGIHACELHLPSSSYRHRGKAHRNPGIPAYPSGGTQEHQTSFSTLFDPSSSTLKAVAGAHIACLASPGRQGTLLLSKKPINRIFFHLGRALHQNSPNEQPSKNKTTQRWTSRAPRSQRSTSSEPSLDSTRKDPGQNGRQTVCNMSSSGECVRFLFSSTALVVCTHVPL